MGHDGKDEMKDSGIVGAIGCTWAVCAIGSLGVTVAIIWAIVRLVTKYG